MTGVSVTTRRWLPRATRLACRTLGATAIMAVAMTGATEATTTIGADRRLHFTRIAAERRRLVGRTTTAIAGHRRSMIAERAITGGAATIATTGQRRATSATFLGRRKRECLWEECRVSRRAGMAKIATTETAESVALPAAATAVDVAISSLLLAGGLLPSHGEGRATSTGGGARLWLMILEVEAAARCSAAPSRAAGRTTGRAGRVRPARAAALTRRC